MKNSLIFFSLLTVAPLLQAGLPTEITELQLNGVSSITGVMATANGNYYASDLSTASLRQYDSSGNLIGQALEAQGTFAGMDVDAVGHLVVAEQEPCQVKVLNNDGSVLLILGQAEAGAVMGDPATCSFLDHPADVAVGTNNEIFVADTGHNRIAVFNGTDGSFLRAWGHLGFQGTDELYQPMGLTVSNGMVYVADAGNGRVMVYGTDGSFIKQISRRGTGDAEFDSPFDVAVDGAGRVWVADNGLQKLVVFDAKDQYLGAYGIAGSRPSFEDLTSLYASEDGTVAIADGYTGRVFVAETGITFSRSYEDAKPVQEASVSLGDAQMAFGPVPARAGQPMVMSLPFKADSVSWEVVSLDMRKVAGGQVQYASLASMDDTSNLASGVYLVRSTVKLAGESRTKIQKIVVTR